MRLYRLGPLAWHHSQLYYHALASLGREGLILCAPRQPYVCLGYSQDAAQELDLAFCRRRGLPIFRRRVGGGAVYLDSDQVFWQLVLRRDNPLVCLDRRAFYRRFLQPVVATYRALGIAAEIQPVNDLVAGGRKIAGTGAGEIGECVVLVGNLMRSFDCWAMARVLNSPDAEFRRTFRRSLEQNLTSIRRELGRQAEARLSDEVLYDLLAAHFAQTLGGLAPARPDAALRAEVERLARSMLAERWVHLRRKARRERRVKVRAGLVLHHLPHPTPAGEIRALFFSRQGRVGRVTLYGQAAEADPGLGRRRQRLPQITAPREMAQALDLLCTQALGKAAG